MRRLRNGALALLVFGSARASLAEIQVPTLENGVPCEPPEIARAVDDRFVRVEADPSQPDINELPTQPLVFGTFALAPDVPAEERLQVGYPPYVACRPAPALETEEEVEPRVDPIPEDVGRLPEG